MEQRILCHLFSHSRHWVHKTMFGSTPQRPHAYSNYFTVRAIPNCWIVCVASVLLLSVSLESIWILGSTNTFSNAVYASRCCLLHCKMRAYEVVWRPPLVVYHVHSPPITHGRVLQVSDTPTIVPQWPEATLFYVSTDQSCAPKGKGRGVLSFIQLYATVVWQFIQSRVARRGRAKGKLPLLVRHCLNPTTPTRFRSFLLCLDVETKVLCKRC